MEKGGVSDGNSLPWCYLCPRTVCQLLHLGPTIKRSDTFHYNVIGGCHVVWHLLSISLHRILLWIPETTIWTACPYQSDSTTGPHANLVHASCALHSRGWRIAIRCLFHRAVLYFFSYLREPILLPFWISLSCFHHSGSFLQSDKVSWAVEIIIRVRKNNRRLNIICHL